MIGALGAIFHVLIQATYTVPLKKNLNATTHKDIFKQCSTSYCMCEQFVFVLFLLQHVHKGRSIKNC